jgi:hypothetical protein
MSDNQVRKGNLQSAQNTPFMNFIYFETGVVSIGAGVYFSNWAIGIGVFFLFAIIVLVRVLRVLFSVTIASACTVLAYFVSQDLSTIEVISICTFVWLVVFGIHLIGMQTAAEAADSD